MTDSTDSQKSSETLLPCPLPWCCAEAKLIDYQTQAGDFSVGCLSCDCATPLYGTKADAIAAWNTRPRSDSVAISEAMIEIPQSLFHFLMGTGEIEGTSFGDLHDRLPGRFWWRALLGTCKPAMRSASADTPPVDQGEVERAINWLGRNAQTIQTAVANGHRTNSAVLSGWMREDESDWRSELSIALAAIRTPQVSGDSQEMK